MPKNKTTSRQDQRLKQVLSAMKKLHRHGMQSAPHVLREEELQVSQEAVRAAVAYVKRSVQRSRAGRLPAHFNFAGGCFPLAYSILGRVFICDPQGNRLLASDYDVI